jgi:hypothetical protein
VEIGRERPSQLEVGRRGDGPAWWDHSLA